MSHALLSPSGASRWIACPPSARLEADFPDTAGDAAKEGTLAHRLCEALLRSFYRLQPEDDLTTEFRAIQADPMYNADMEQHCQDYAAFVISTFVEASNRTKGSAELIIEQKIDLRAYVPEGFGTGDAIVAADETVEIIDFKYGKGVRVDCENNKQMMLYALGVLEDFGLSFDIKTVRMTIFQPRLDNVSSFEMSADELTRWGREELKPVAELAFEGGGDFKAGKHCHFCKARNRCRALADHNLELAKMEFRNATLLTDEEVAEVLSKADMFKKWVGGIESFAEAEAIHNGKKWPGWKLVEGRSNRVYADQDKVVEVLKGQGYAEELLFAPRTVLGITAMEKVVGKKAFTELLSPYVIKPQGKPTLVPEADKRAEWSTAESAAKDFL